MNNKVDLHTHTTKSDGTYTPNQLLLEAENKGIQLLSITDHESVEAYYDIDKTIFSGKIISGIELRTTCFGINIELLGYGFDINKMRNFLKKYHYKDTTELDEYIINIAYEQYKKIGVKLDSNFVKDYNPNIHSKPSKYLKKCISKYPENKSFLKNLPEGKSFFRFCMTNPNSPLFINFSTAFPSIKEIITIIKESDGFVSIPHIFEYQENSKKILNELLENHDIDIIECYYPSFTEEQTKYLLKIAKKYNKYISGGSDFHGTARPRISLGSGENDNLYVPIESVLKWVKLIK